MVNNSSANQRFYVLGLAALTNTFCIAMQQICMSVLFKEISDDLGLNLVEVGVVWGITSLAAFFAVLIGGTLADRYGVKHTLSYACLLSGLAGALRGLSGSFTSLTLISFLFGLSISIIYGSVFKAAATRFSQRQLGVANGILTTGMGVGLTIGPMISATILSPLLGGWRSVLFFYGAISVIIGLLWLLTVREPGRVGSSDSRVGVPLRQAVSRVFPIKAVWILGLSMLGYTGCIQGMIGYLPLYLRGSGWTAASADGTLAVFAGLSTLGAIPLTMLSDKLGLRKMVIYPILLITVVGVALLPVVGNAIVWLVVAMIGIPRDGFFALCFTMSTETEGIGIAYSGTAIGLMQTIYFVGPFISPPIGNSLADTNSSLPFFFWAALGLLSLFIFYFVKETKYRKV